MDFETKMIHQCVLFGCSMMHHSCLRDSAKNVSSKLLSQVVGENVFGQSVSRVFLFLLCWKLFKLFMIRLVILTHVQSMLFENRNHSIDFLCKSIYCTLYEYDIGFKFFKKLFSEYFLLNSLVVLILSWCFNEVMRIKICICWHNGYWHCR